MGEERIDDVSVMLGNPKKAILAMAVPIMIAMVIQSLNSVIDAVWVSGLGTGALAAVGVAFPFFFILIGIGNGFGTGSAQALARRIGAGDRAGANNVAAQAVMMTLVTGLAAAVIFLFLTEPAMVISGAGDYLEECVDYAFPLLVCSPFILMSALFSGLLRSEGAAKRSMMVQVVASVINIVLDPIFIYVFGWGVAGAAWATVLATAVSLVLALYWYYVRRDTYIRIDLRGFRFDRALDRDILRVGIPASMEMVVMAVTSLVMNLIILGVDPANGIAVYSTGWRLIDILMIPVMAVGFVLVPISASAYGAGRHDKIDEAYRYSLKLGTLVMLGISLLTFALADHMVILFTYDGATSALAPEMAYFVRVCCLFMPFLGLGFVSASFFQSLGKGLRSLMATMLMNLLRIPVCVGLASFGVLSYIWFGVAASEIIGSVLIGAWGMLTLRALLGGRRDRGESS